MKVRIRDSKTNNEWDVTGNVTHTLYLMCKQLKRPLYMVSIDEHIISRAASEQPTIEPIDKDSFMLDLYNWKSKITVVNGSDKQNL